MIAIENTLVSDEVFTEFFCCNLQKCKGCCCIEGDAGAPLEKDEVALLAKYYPFYREYMTEEGRAVVENRLAPDRVDSRQAIRNDNGGNLPEEACLPEGEGLQQEENLSEAGDWPQEENLLQKENLPQEENSSHAGKKHAGGKYVFYEVFPLDNSLLTPLINHRDCVYLTPAGEDGIAYCAIEKAFMEGKIPFRKPVSCALFPIRVQHYPHYDALNYFRWDICRDAERLGKRKGIPVFRFLKEPLIDAYGEEWYKEAEAVYKAVFASGKRS